MDVTACSTVMELVKTLPGLPSQVSPKPQDKIWDAYGRQTFLHARGRPKVIPTSTLGSELFRSTFSWIRAIPKYFFKALISPIGQYIIHNYIHICAVALN